MPMCIHHNLGSHEPAVTRWTGLDRRDARKVRQCVRVEQVTRSPTRWVAGFAVDWDDGFAVRDTATPRMSEASWLAGSMPRCSVLCSRLQLPTVCSLDLDLSSPHSCRPRSSRAHPSPSRRPFTPPFPPLGACPPSFCTALATVSRLFSTLNARSRACLTPRTVQQSLNVARPLLRPR